MFNSIIAESKTSKKIPEQISQIITDLKPVAIKAAPGTGKTFISKLIHNHSSLKSGMFVEIDCAKLPRNQEGMVDNLGLIPISDYGTLLLDNAHLLSEQVYIKITQYLENGEKLISTNNTPWQFLSPNSWVRLIIASSEKIQLAELDIHNLKLLPLTQRRGDIPNLAAYFLEKYCQENGRNILKINQAVLRRLISYNYPRNIAELEDIIKRMVWMTPKEELVIPEKLLWYVESKKNAYRIDLLNQLPWLRKFFLSKWWPQGVWVLVMAVFIPVTISGFLGPQNPSESMILNFLWAWWWSFSLLLFPFVGRLWCSICPFMVTGEWIRKLSLWIWPRELLSWPTKWLNKWGGWLMWIGFLAIYLWEKLWDLPHTAYLSASLLLLITGGAVICSLIYEHRLWCRYLCPIGAMNGMFAKLSMTELRASEQVCGTQCDVFACRQGSDVSPVTFIEALPNEGQAIDACPLHSIPSKLMDNRDCVLCMGCVKGCPNRSVQLNLRFPGSDLWESHQPFWAEVALLLLLFGGVFMHYSDKFLGWFGVRDITLDSQHLLTAVPLISLLLTIPFVATYLTHRLTKQIDKEMPNYLTVIYAYLPMTLGFNLVYYISGVITEAGNILPVMARTFGLSGASLPSLTWNLEVATFLQEITLVLILLLSIYPLVKITKRPFIRLLPHLLLMVGFNLIFLNLIL